MMMTAGRLDTELHLFAITSVDDGAGGKELAPIADDADGDFIVWASIEPATAKQEERAARREQRISHCVMIRWQAELLSFGPDARGRFVDRAGRTRWLSVRTVADPDEDGRWLELMCMEGGPR